jgi:hypothetical protein
MLTLAGGVKMFPYLFAVVVAVVEYDYKIKCTHFGPWHPEVGLCLLFDRRPCTRRHWDP